MQGSAWTYSDSWGSTASPCSLFGVLCCEAYTSGTCTTGGAAAGVIVDAKPSLPSCCQSKGAVLAVSLPGYKLRGSLAAAFFTSIKSLVSFDLRGKIGCLLGTLSALTTGRQQLCLSAGNFLTGSIPGDLDPTNLPFLNGIFLDQNELTGIIPSTVFQFTTLLTLRLVSRS